MQDSSHEIIGLDENEHRAFLGLRAAQVARALAWQRGQEVSVIDWNLEAERSAAEATSQ